MPSKELSLGFSIVDLARLFRRRFERAVARSGLDITAGEARTLMHLNLASPVRQAALAERMLVEPMSLSNVLDRLEARGLVERRTDPDDRRAKLVTMTKTATPMVAKLAEISARVREQATEGLGEGEIAAVRRAIAIMRGNLCADAPAREAAE
jgi:MarR family transcriptional regulator for hemolysin